MTTDELKMIQDRINHRPRKRLGFKTTYEVFHQSSSSIAKCSVWDTTRVNIYFIGVLFTVLMLVTYVPVTGLGLVNYFYN